MPRDEHTPRSDAVTTKEQNFPKNPLDLGHSHTSSDCREIASRLRAQVECLEELLADLRTEIDELESQEIIDRTREELYEAES